MTIKINLNFLNMSNHWIMLNVALEWEEAAIEAIDQGCDICWIDRDRYEKAVAVRLKMGFREDSTQP